MDSSAIKYVVNKCFPALLLLILGVVVYANTFDGEFLWDDKSYIVDSPYIRDFNNILLVFQPWKFNQLPGGFVDITRPIMFASLLIDYQFWGLNPAGYHITNGLLHIIASILVYFLSINLKIEKKVSLLAALLFLVHPVHTEAVAGMTFREDLFVTVFFISALIFFIKSVAKSENHNPVTNYVLATVFYILALLSKEMAVTFPLIAFIYLVLLYDGFLNIYKRLLLVFPLILITIPYLIWVGQTYTSLPSPPVHGEGGVYFALINIPSIIVYYLKILLFPFNLSADPGYILKTSFFNVNILASSFFLLLIVIFIVRDWKKHPLCIFLLFYFFSTLLPVLQILPTFNLVAERFLYMSSAGGAILGALMLKKFLGSKAPLVLLAFIIFSFSLLTIERNLVWNDALTLWTDALKKNDRSYYARINISNYHFENKDYKKAETGFLEIIGKWPDRAEAYNNLAIIYMESYLYPKAEAILKQAILMKAATAETYMNLAVSLNELGLYKEAIATAQSALKVGPWLMVGNDFFANAYVGLGKTMLDKEDFTGALDAFGRAIVYGYRGFDIYVYMARGYYGVGNYKKSIEEYKKVLSVNGNYGDAIFFIGESLRNLGNYEEALVYYREFLSKWSRSPYAQKAESMVREMEVKSQ